MKQKRYVWADKIEEFINDLRYFGRPVPTFRHYDLTEITDDPGNTCLYMTFVGNFEPMKEDYPISLIKTMLEDIEGFGTYEEFIVFDQNNEVVIMINSNQ